MMETLTMNSGVQQIGETAGAVWHALNENGPLSLAKLVEKVGINRDAVMQGVGWLAREGKIEIEEGKRGKVISLRD
jgi:predicted ArsR family transcriptional regulator